VLVPFRRLSRANVQGYVGMEPWGFARGTRPQPATSMGLSAGLTLSQFVQDESRSDIIQLHVTVLASPLLSAVHILTLPMGLGALFMRGRALDRPPADIDWDPLFAADNAWGIAAGLWIASGLARVFLGGKEPSFYWYNGFFWVKLALFALVFAIEVTPMMTFIRMWSARKQGAPPPRFSVVTLRRINRAEIALVIAIVFVAAFMARGAWLL
jgi:putative membrane protein